MSIYERLNIKSKINDYSVLFVSAFNDGLAQKSGRNFFLILDRKVAKYYKDEFRGILQMYPYLLVTAAENHKTIDYAKSILRYLIDNNIRKNYTLVAIGGGVIQDITGFVASILYRGVNWVFYPTTLLSQCDSCIGSKTSINIDGYKNQVGNFYPPQKVFLNVNFLKTLPLREIKSGLGEIIKVHLLEGRRAMEFVAKNYAKALSNPEVMSSLIFRSLGIKKRIIEKDEFDRGYRNIMNYGHTFGHALESLSNYRLGHGQAVTIGMDISNYLSYKLGYINKTTYKKLKILLLKNWPDYELKNINLNLFFKSLSKDKKNTDDKITMILTRGAGKMMKKSLAIDSIFKDRISAYFKHYI